MVTVAVFYAAIMWTRLFGAKDPAYTIVPGYHIGLDIGTGRKAIDVPALLGGTVVAVVKSPQLGGVVVVKVGELYFSYCHLAWRNLPKAGTVLEQGDRVGTLASSKDPASPDYGGSLWNGIHLHLVIGEHPRSAYAQVPGHRTLDKFRDPATVIAGALAALAGAKPFNPKEDDMSQADIDWMKNTLTNITNAINDPKIGILGAANAARDHAVSADGKLDKVGADAANAAGIASEVRNLITDPTVGVLAAIGRTGGNVDVTALAKQLRASLGAEVADELAKRLAG